MEITSQNPIAVANFIIETVKKNVPKKGHEQGFDME